MFLLFFAFVASTFLPFSVTNGVVYDTLTDKTYKRILQSFEDVVILYIPENYEYAEDYKLTFSKLPTVFSSDIGFFILTDRTAKKTFKKLNIQNPTIIFYKKGDSSLTIPFPETESELMAVVSNFIDPENSKPIKTKGELFNSLGETSYTLISPPKLYDIATQLVATMSSVYGPFSIKCVEPEVIEELGYKPYKLLIYRKADKVITEVDSSSSSFDDIVIPKVFNHLTSDVIYDIEGEIAILVYKDKATSSQKDLLADLSSKYKFFFGSMPLEDAGIIFDIIGEVRKEPFFIIFNEQDFYFYQIPENIDDKTIANYVDDVANKRIKPIYPSEEIPEKQDRYLTKVVGKNYEEFISDEENDVLMFYFNGKVDLEFPEYVATYLNETEIKFGYINIANNSCPTKFPVLFSMPHVQFFPAYKKDLNMTYYGSRGIFSLVNFLRRNSRSKITLDMKLLDRDFEIAYLTDILNDIDEYSQETKAEIIMYIEATGKALGIGNTVRQIVEALHKMQKSA